MTSKSKEIRNWNNYLCTVCPSISRYSDYTIATKLPAGQGSRRAGFRRGRVAGGVGLPAGQGCRQGRVAGGAGLQAGLSWHSRSWLCPGPASLLQSILWLCLRHQLQDWMHDPERLGVSQPETSVYTSLDWFYRVFSLCYGQLVLNWLQTLVENSDDISCCSVSVAAWTAA